MNALTFCGSYLYQFLISVPFCYKHFQEQELAQNLLDGDPDTFWESDGSLGRHYIRLQIMSGVIIQ